MILDEPGQLVALPARLGGRQPRVGKGLAQGVDIPVKLVDLLQEQVGRLPRGIAQLTDAG